MTEQFKIGEQFQRASQEGFDAVVRAYGEANKGLQAIAAEVADYSKKALEDATRAFQQLVTAKSAEQAFEIQSQYAKGVRRLPCRSVEARRDVGWSRA